MITRVRCALAFVKRIARTAGSICYALLTPQPGEMTFAMNKGRLAEGYAVSEAEVRRAVRFAFETLKLVVEPEGAVGLAAMLSGKITKMDKNIGIILSGGNVDPNPFAEILRKPRRRLPTIFFHQRNFLCLACRPANDDDSLFWFGCLLVVQGRFGSQVPQQRLARVSGSTR